MLSSVTIHIASIIAAEFFFPLLSNSLYIKTMITVYDLYLAGVLFGVNFASIIDLTVINIGGLVQPAATLIL